MAITIGCGDSGPVTYPVTGTIKIGGSPAADIMVSYHPDSSDNQTASGVTDASGKYIMYTGVSGTEGVMAGKYSVTLQASETGEGDYMSSGENPNESNDPTKKEAGAIPADWSESVEVTSGDNVFDFEL